MSKCFTRYTVMYSYPYHSGRWHMSACTEAEVAVATGKDTFDLDDDYAEPAVFDDLETAQAVATANQEKSDKWKWGSTYRVFRTTYREAPVI